MYKRNAFAFREFLRICYYEYELIISYIVFSSLYLLLILFNLLLVFNVKFLKETDAFLFERNLVTKTLRKIYFLDKYIFVFYIFLGLIILFYLIFNKKKIQQFIKKFEEELLLIARFKGSDCEGRLVLNYLVIFINFLAVVFSWIVGYFFYKSFCFFSEFYLLDFSRFQITLFLSLLLISEIVGILSLYFLFWQKNKK